MHTSMRSVAAFIAALLIAFTTWSWARAEVAVPPLSAAVTDLTATLSAQQVGELDAKLKAFSQQRGSQIAVLLVPTTQPEAIEQYSIRVADAWKIGRKGKGRDKDDGVIVLVAKNDRALRIEVGYGLEGAIPDAIAKRVIDETITPKFRAGDFYGGLDAGATALMKLIEGEKLPAPAPQAKNWMDEGFNSNTLFYIFIALVFIGGIARAVAGRLVGSVVGAGLVSLIIWMAIGSLVAAVLAGMVGFLISLAMGGSGGMGGGRGRGGWGGGGWSGGGGGFGGGGGGGGFSGGGGGFGGGGASGRW